MTFETKEHGGKICITSQSTPFYNLVYIGTYNIILNSLQG
jgi:hypothetical protein